MQSQFDNTSLNQTFRVFESKAKNIENSLNTIIKEITNLKNKLSLPDASTLYEAWEIIQKGTEKASKELVEKKEKIVEMYKMYEESMYENDNAITSITDSTLENISKILKEMSNL